MNFSVASGVPIAGRLIYDKPGLSFDFERMSRDSTESALGGVELGWGNMVLEVDRATGDVLGVSGYNPSMSWRDAALGYPTAISARIRAHVTDPPEPGIVVGICNYDSLLTQCDRSTGWLRVGRIGIAPSLQRVEFATGCIAELDGSELVALWLHPEVGVCEGA